MSITVRRMRFEYPEDLDTVFIAGEPEESFVNIGLSLLLPHLEPYLIRTMKEARAQVKDPRLSEDLQAFVLQEGQHYQQHKRFNELFHDRGFDRLPALEAEMAADYERFSREKSLAFNLAYAEGFEALTTAMASIFLELDRSNWHPCALALFEWHLVEELEHRCVAFDVYQHVSGDYLNRVRVGSFAQRHLLGFLLRVMEHMIERSPREMAAHGGQRGHRRRVRRLNQRLVFQILPLMLRSHLPGYSPHRLVVPASLEALATRYTESAEHTRPSSA